MDNINFNLLSHCFNQRKFTRRGFADEIGISRDTISNVLSGKNCPSYSVATRLVCGLDLTREEILAIFFHQLESPSEVSQSVPDPSHR